MKVYLIVVGKTSDKYIEEGISKYLKRINHYIKFEIITIPAIKISKKISVNELKEKESEAILKKITEKNFIVLLDEKGKRQSSVKFAEFIENKTIAGVKNLFFVVGGAYGFSDKIKQQADFLLSLSDMTFSHQIIRLIFTEQIYRAFTIIKNEPYHNE